jgi:hypothetical protein
MVDDRNGPYVGCEACLAYRFGQCDGDMVEDCLGPFYTVASWEMTKDGGI